MRCRYSAYVLEREDYLLATWHASTRPAALDLGATPRPKWIGLQVNGHSQDAADPDRATVQFVARYRVGGRAYRLAETSRFLREGGRWYYLDGDVER